MERISVVQHLRNKHEARKQRRELQDKYGRARVVLAEADMRECLVEADGDADKAAELFEQRWRRLHDDGPASIAMILLFVQLAVLAYKILKYFGYLTPTPEQFEQVYSENP